MYIDSSFKTNQPKGALIHTLVTVSLTQYYIYIQIGSLLFDEETLPKELRKDVIYSFIGQVNVIVTGQVLLGLK